MFKNLIKNLKNLKILTLFKHKINHMKKKFRLLKSNLKRQVNKWCLIQWNVM